MARVDMTSPVFEGMAGGGGNVGFGGAGGLMPGSGPIVGGPTSRIFAAVAADFVVGEIREWTVALAPADWQICDGTALLVASFPDLFAVIAYTFGGAGLNFNVPDIRGRGVVGAGTAVALAANDGLAEAARDPINHDHPAGGAVGAVPVAPATAMPLELIHMWSFTTGFDLDEVRAQVGAGPWASVTGHFHTMTNTFDSHESPDLDHLHTGGVVTSLANWPDHLGLPYAIRTAT